MERGRAENLPRFQGVAVPTAQLQNLLKRSRAEQQRSQGSATRRFRDPFPSAEVWRTAAKEFGILKYA